jgi:hypothetical protein
VTSTRGWSTAGAGPYDIGVFVQVQVIGDAAVVGTVAGLEPRDEPRLALPGEPDPVGRAQIVGQAAAELANGMSVQLFGAPGVGKKAVARAVIRRLGSGSGAAAGVELLPPAGRPHTLESVYERLAQAFFRGITFEPPEDQLRAAAQAAGVSGLIVILDCELTAQDLGSLLATFPDCVFLLTSGHRTLYRNGATHEVGPLPLDAAMELIAQETGRSPAGLARLQVAQAYNLAAGRVQRLLQYAAFLQFARNRPGHDPLAVFPAREQASLLAAGLPEPARRVLAALATFAAQVPPSCFAAVTGLPEGSDAAEAGPELLAAALVSRAGGGYRITPDAAAAVEALGWEPASALTAGRGLLEQLAGQGAPPGPELLLSVSRRLHGGGDDLQASRLIRAGLPGVLEAGYIDDWMRLVGLGLQAASAAGASADLAYFAQEESARRLLQGDESVDPSQIAAEAAAEAAAAGPDRDAGFAGAGAGFFAGGEEDDGTAPMPRPRLRRAARAAGIAVAAAAVAGGVIVALVLAGGQAGHHPVTLVPGLSPSAGGATSPAQAGRSSGPAPHRSRPAAKHPKPSPGQSSSRAAHSPRPTTSPRPSASASGSPSPSPSPSTPAAVVQSYFAAITAKNYQLAWSLGGDNLGGTFAQFEAGFADTASDTVSIVSVQGGTVTVNLTAAQTNGTDNFYSGVYIVSGGVITASDVQRTG